MLKRKNIGFTLIELLVVISIIAVLMSIMMPALGRARGMAKSIMCSSRLKDLGTVFSMYLLDNKNCMPSNHPDKDYIGTVAKTDYRWNTRLGDYYDRKKGSQSREAGGAYDFEIFRCPTQEDVMKKIKKGDLAPTVGIYGYNVHFLQHEPASDVPYMHWKKHELIQQPVSLPVLADIDAESPAEYAKLPPIDGEPKTSEGIGALLPDWPAPLAMKHGWPAAAANAGKYKFNGPAPVHEGTTVYLMADWHVQKSNNMWPYDTDKWQENQRYKFHPRRDPKGSGPGGVR